MDEWQGNATEGVAKSVICSVSYKCKKNTPTFEWNYKDMQSSLHTEEISSSTFKTVSNLTFIGSLEDNGKSLTCTARFMTGETSDSATLHIKGEFLHVIHCGQLRWIKNGRTSEEDFIDSPLLPFFSRIRTNWRNRSTWKRQWVYISYHFIATLHPKWIHFYNPIWPFFFLQCYKIWLPKSLSDSPPLPAPVWWFPVASSITRICLWRVGSGPKKKGVLSIIMAGPMC